MSEHITGITTFDKKAYRKRRKEGQPGMERPVLERPVDYKNEVNEETGEPKYRAHFGPNRRRQRQRIVNRGATKKGMMHLIHVDENRQATRIFAPKGSRPYNVAMHNRQRLQKATGRGE